jgi:anti-sigma factor RsiW
MADLKDILNNDDNLKDDDLLKYADGNLSKDELHKVEKQMVDSDFVSDAMEGLQSIRNKKNIKQYVDELNHQLHKQVSGQKQKREKRKLKDQNWIVLTVIVVVALCIIAFAVIRFYQQRSNPATPANIETRKS